MIYVMICFMNLRIHSKAFIIVFSQKMTNKAFIVENNH